MSGGDGLSAGSGCCHKLGVARVRRAPVAMLRRFGSDVGTGRVGWQGQTTEATGGHGFTVLNVVNNQTIEVYDNADYIAGQSDGFIAIHDAS